MVSSDENFSLLKSYFLISTNQFEFTLLREEDMSVHKVLVKDAEKQGNFNGDLVKILRSLGRGGHLLIPTNQIDPNRSPPFVPDSATSTPALLHLSSNHLHGSIVTLGKVLRIMNNEIIFADKSGQFFRYEAVPGKCISRCRCGFVSRHVLVGDLFRIQAVTNYINGSLQVLGLEFIHDILPVRWISLYGFDQETVYDSNNSRMCILNGRATVQYVTANLLVISISSGEVLVHDKPLTIQKCNNVLIHVGDAVKFHAVEHASQTVTKWEATYLALENWHNDLMQENECPTEYSVDLEETCAKTISYQDTEITTEKCGELSIQKETSTQTLSTGHIVMTKLYTPC